MVYVIAKLMDSLVINLKHFRSPRLMRRLASWNGKLVYSPKVHLATLHNELLGPQAFTKDPMIQTATLDEVHMPGDQSHV